MSEAVTGYLESLAAQDWEALAATLTAGPFERVGPFCDVVADQAAYVAFLDGIVSTLADYHVSTRRLSVDGDAVYAEVTESFELHDQQMAFPEVLVFDLDGEGLIKRVQVYMMRPGDEAAVAGGSASVPGGGSA